VGPLRLRLLRFLRLKAGRWLENRKNRHGKAFQTAIVQPQEPQQPQGTSIPAVTTDPDEAELDERKAMAMASVPKLYLDAWGRLQCQKPMRISDGDWRQAIDDGGRFLDQWGNLAAELQWTSGEIFDVPRDGRQGGLLWFLKGDTVRVLGPEHAVTISGRVYERKRI
jgi:hypothetical protein